MNILIKTEDKATETTTAKTPLVLAYGMGVDSTAVLVEWKNRGIRPDMILFADTGDEKEETYDYLPIIQNWLKDAGFPPVQVVTNVVRDFKNWPPYNSLSQNCLTNGTLPSLAFGFKSCSLKWKVRPQERFTKSWAPAAATWKAGLKVRKAIGYDASPNDRKRFAHAVGMEDAKYEYQYPLIDWNADRDACKAIIRAEGLPVPVKSACYHCPATKPAELHEMKAEYLKKIVILEARAKPRLQTVEGLWRNGRKGTRGGLKMPGTMTQYILEKGLLDPDTIARLQEVVPPAIVSSQEAFAQGFQIPGWHDFLEAFTEEDAACEGCGGGCDLRFGKK